MPASAPVSPVVSARIIHAALMFGVLLFCVVAFYVGSRASLTVSELPDRRFLYIALFLASAILFGGAVFSAGRLPPPGPGTSQDDWWRANLGRAVVIWGLVETPALLGTVAYLITHDFRTLIATFTGLLLFVNYRPSRLAEL